MRVFGIGSCVAVVNGCGVKVCEGEQHPFLQRLTEISWKRIARVWGRTIRAGAKPFGTVLKVPGTMGSTTPMRGCTPAAFKEMQPRCFCTTNTLAVTS